jgi:glutathione peroxidase-family protein
MSQEPGTDDEIQNFCKVNYGVSFPVLGKIDVNGTHESPVYQYLKSKKYGERDFVSSMLKI